MVDRKSRTELSSALRQLFNFRLTTAEFRERAAREWYESSDRAVSIISRFGASALSPDPVFPSWLDSGRLDSIPAYRKAARCIWFLQTDLAYDWPPRPEHRAVGRWGRVLVIASAGASVTLALLTLVDWFSDSKLCGGSAIWWMLAAMSVTVLGWALLRLWFQSAEQRFQRAGDAQVWPFQTRGDYSQARRARAMLRGVSDDIE